MIQVYESIQPSRRAWLSVAAYAAMFVFGIVMALLGAVLPVLSEQLELDLARAGNLFFTLNFAWGCFVVGRIIASRLVLKIASTTLVLASALGSALGAGLLAFSPTIEVATLALAIIGLSFASIFPTTLSQAASTFHSYLGTVFGVLFAISLTGGMMMPWAVGQIAESHGLRYGLALVAGNFIMIFVLQLIIWRRR